MRCSGARWCVVLVLAGEGSVVRMFVYHDYIRCVVYIGCDATYLLSHDNVYSNGNEVKLVRLYEKCGRNVCRPSDLPLWEA